MWLRAPFGAITDEQIEWCVAHNIRRANTAQAISQRVLKYVHLGAIILLHSAGRYKKQTMEALPAITGGIHKRGYAFVTVPQLLKLPDNIPSTGSAAEGKQK
ncbi:MAG: hypothetical protein RMJ87_07200 [Cytophagales bacterium]|nr:hypothetical protein [Bernardetiaceae bacterium]MDW8204798.1 hypothetical protein [Cytophagales bacterium]